MAFNLVCWLRHTFVNELGGLLLLIPSSKSALADELGYTFAEIPTQFPLKKLLLPLRFTNFKVLLDHQQVLVRNQAEGSRHVPGKEAMTEFHETLHFFHGMTRSMHILDGFSVLLPLLWSYAR